MVSSKKALARIERYDASFRTADGLLHVSRRTMRIYDYVLDEAQTSALREARELAGRSGLGLEVTDLSRQNVFRRMLNFGLHKNYLAVRVESGSPLGPRLASREPQQNREGVTPLVAQP